MKDKKISGLLMVPIVMMAAAMPAVAQTECYAFPRHAESGLSLGLPASVGFNPTLLAKVDQQINQDIQHGFPGVELLIIKDNKVIKHSVYGYRSKYDQQQRLLAKPQPLGCNTMFDLASNTKMYATNYALMHLVFEGKLDLNQPITNYLPEYRGCDAHGQCREQRTVRDLLTHTAGYMPDPQFFNPRTITQYGNGLYSQQGKLTESILLQKLPFARGRGGSPEYSDVDFMLLGLIVEKISQMSLDQYVTTQIYQPLGLTHTWFNPLAHGFSAADCAATEISGNSRGGRVNFPNIRTTPIQCQVHDEKAYYSMQGVAGHAGLFSSGADLAILTSIALNNGSYENLVWWNAQVESQFLTAVAGADNFGLGWRLAGKQQRYAPFGHYASSQAFGHTGWTGTFTLIDPHYHLVIILLTNKRHTLFEHGKFKGDSFASGRYAPIIDLIYKALTTPNLAHI